VPWYARFVIPPSIPPDEVRRLEELHSLRLLDTPKEERFDRITRIALSLFRVPVALIALVDEKRGWFKSRQGIDVAETSREISFCGHAILGPGAMVVEDATKDPRFWDNPMVLGKAHFRFYAGHPLCGPRGARVGTLCLVDREPRSLADTDLGLLVDLARIAESELAAGETAELVRLLRERERELDDFFERTSDLVQSVDERGTLVYVNRRWKEALGFVDAPLPPSALHVVDPEDRERYREAIRSVIAGNPVDHVDATFVATDGRKLPVTGCITPSSSKHAAHTDIFRDMSEEARYRAELVHLAATDDLTGLTNRRSFRDVARTLFDLSRRHGRPLSIALVDVDRFKTVNDRRGHESGDGVLRRLAALLTARLRSSDIAARYGGDEFFLAFPETSAVAAGAIIDDLRVQFRAGSGASAGSDEAVTFSAGVAEIDASMRSLDDLLRAADEALYLAKSAGRDCVVRHG
jgi:diguanylate cyclase (GGDEF)-like protein/PAS domain S-box-containing protein